MATPTGIGARLQAGLRHHQNGHLDKASREYKRVLQAMPDQPDALNLLGVVELAQGRAAHAQGLILKALKLRPKEASFHCNLGSACTALGLLGEAKEAYVQCLRFSPKFALAHFNLGLIHVRENRATDAGDAFQSAIACDRSLWQAHVELARVAEGLGQMDLAERSFAQALQQQPRSGDIKSLFAEFLARRDRFDEAMALHRAALEQSPDSQPSTLALARTCYRARRYDAAVDACRQALALDDGSADAWNELGRALRTVGEISEARVCFARAVTIDPCFADGHRNLALLGSAASPGQYQALKHLLAQGRVQGKERMLASFAMGKMLDDAGDYDAAFAAYSQANTLALAAHAAAGHSFSPESFSQVIDDLIAGDVTPAPWVCQSDIPVFVLGAPRSGTSLVEQIASTHPAVHGAGELRTIARIADLSGRADPGEMQAVVDAYLADLIGRKNLAIRGIDKMPDNAFHISTILSVFPKARIIWCRRDPLDNLLSCYFQHFSSGNVFSYNLEHCAHRLRETARLHQHWAARAAPNMLEVVYEDLVRDPDTAARRIVEFLGLPWDARCLAFHETIRPVATASGWQVRQPLYQTAVGRWRHYERHLAAVRQVLQPV